MGSLTGRQLGITEMSKLIFGCGKGSKSIYTKGDCRKCVIDKMKAGNWMVRLVGSIVNPKMQKQQRKNEDPWPGDKSESQKWSNTNFGCGDGGKSIYTKCDCRKCVIDEMEGGNWMGRQVGATVKPKMQKQQMENGILDWATTRHHRNVKINIWMR